MSNYTLPRDLINDSRMPAAYAKADAVIARIGPVSAPQRDRMAVDMFYDPGPAPGSYEIEDGGHLIVRRGFNGTTLSAEIDRRGYVVETW